MTGDSGSKSSQQEVTDSLNGAQPAGQAVRALMQASGIPDSVPLFLGEYNVDGGDYNDPANANMVGAVSAAATTYGMIHSNANFTMGALWDVQNDSAYSVFGHQGSYQVDPVGVVLADLTAYMPGNMVQTAMPSNTPGLVGYATKSGGGFSVALIDTNLSQGYTVDLSKDGLPTSGLFQVEVSAANPKGAKTALTDLSHVSVAAGSVVIITNEAPHGGTELNGTTSTATASATASAPVEAPNASPTPPATSASAPAALPAAGTGTAATAAATDLASTSPSGSSTQAMTGTGASSATATATPVSANPAGTAQAQAASTAASNPAESFAPSARGGSLLPSGYLSTSGNQVVDAAGNPVRIDAIGWYGTDGPAGSALQGLWSTSYGQILDSIKGDGFNAVRIPWSDADLNTPFAGTNQLGGVDWSQNADLKGLTTLQVFGKIVDYAGKIGLKVVFDHHTDDGSGGQQPNGLWIDKGPGTNGTDGAGVPGTVDAAKFQADWVQLAKSFAGNSTVIGFDLDNEPAAQSTTWGGGGPTDIQKMYTDVGNAVEAADPGALVIAEGLVTPDGQGGYPMILAAAKGNPVVLNTPDKVVYSVHSYPAEIGGGTDATGPAAVKAMTDQWGYLEAQNIAPVWVGEIGSNMTSTGSQAWSKTLLGYMNGQDGAQGGPTFGGSQQPVGGSWWNIGSEGGQGNPDGNQTAWGPGHYKPEQQAVTDQMLFKPTSGPSAAPAAASGAGQAASSAGSANPGNATPGGASAPPSTDNSGMAGTSTAAAGTDPSTAAAPGGAISASTTASAPAGTGADTLVLNLSEDAYQGDARFQLTVDGKAAGSAQAVTALHGQGQSEAFTFKGDWTGAHTFGVTFTNDAWGGSADMDRNLYVGSTTFDGTAVQGAAALYGNGTVTFGTPASQAPQGGATSQAGSGGSAMPAPAGTLTVTDSDGSSAAVPLVASGSRTDHPTGTSTVQQAAGGGTDTITSSGSVKGEALALGGGTQKLLLVNPRALVLTGGPGADTVTVDGGDDQFVAGSGSLDVTGGPGAAAYVLHAGGGPLTVEDFDPAKGDTLTVDKALQGALVQASDGHGGTLLAFGAKQGSIDLINHASVSPSAIRFI